MVWLKSLEYHNIELNTQDQYELWKLQVDGYWHSPWFSDKKYKPKLQTKLDVSDSLRTYHIRHINVEWPSFEDDVIFVASTSLPDTFSTSKKRFFQ